MVKTSILMAVTVLAMPLMAQQTNTINQPNPEPKSAQPEKRERPKPTPEQREKFKERHLKLMEKALKEIGVT